MAAGASVPTKSIVVLKASPDGGFSIHELSRGQIARVDITDVDLILTSKSGAVFVLPGAAIAGMGDHSPEVVFANETVPVSTLLAEVGEVVEFSSNTPIPSTLQKETAQELIHKLELQHKLDLQHNQELQHKFDTQTPPTPPQQPPQEQTDKPITTNTEASVEKLVEEVQKIEENLHSSDYNYIPPAIFQPPPSPPAAPPGVPPPISLEPQVALFMGNVVGTTVVGNTIYGGGGAVGSDAAAKIGPRDALQFSPATITGTSGNDLIYANGPLVGNDDPSTDTSNNARQFQLNVAGYFTQLNDVIISGVPASVAIVGATQNMDGTWTLPSQTVIKNDTFTLVYNMDNWHASNVSTFDVTFLVSGTTTRHGTFSTTQSFRFEYIDVTDPNEVTDPTLVYNDHGLAKQIYVLPTLSQPSIISSDDGNDTIFGGLNNDSITAGDGNDSVSGDSGDDVVIAGMGSNSISLGSGDNTATVGDGNDTVTALDGNNTIVVGGGIDLITVGTGDNTITSTGSNADTVTATNGNNTITLSDGVNVITVGNGNNAIITGNGGSTILAGNGNDTITGGSGNNNITVGNGLDTIITTSGDDVIHTGSGTVTINAGDGNNTIVTGGGAVAITTGIGIDSITANGGGGTIAAGDGINTILVTTGNYSITTGTGDDSITGGGGNNTINVGSGNNTVSLGNGNNTIITAIGNDTLVAGNGTNIFQIGGAGTHILTGGTGSNTVDYTALTTTAISTTLLGGTTTGTGLSETLTNIANVIGTTLADTIVGNVSSNVLSGGDGNDTLTGGGGNDTFYGGNGNDSITAGIGNDLIYAGDGNNTVREGTAGADWIYGGSGNNTFISQHAGVHYDGTNGVNLVNGQYNTVDYSADVTGMTINLLSGVGSGGLADGDTYAATPTNGKTSINEIIGGSGLDVITASNANNILYGNGGNDTFYLNNGTDFVYGGAGFNVFIDQGTTGSKTIDTGNGGYSYWNYGAGNTVWMGRPAENIVTTAGSPVNIMYGPGLVTAPATSPSGILVNLDSVSHTVVNSNGVTVTINPSSGAGWGVTAADALSYSIGDTFTQGGVAALWGSSYNDVVFGTTTGLTFYGGAGTDYFFGGTGSDTLFLATNARFDGGGGTNALDADWWANGNFVIYLDGTADINANGKADYIDYGAAANMTIAAGSSPTGSALTYTGFSNYGGTSNIEYFKNIQNVYGSQTGNDTIVGDANNNSLVGGTGSNSIYGGSGNDTIYDFQGSNSLDGGIGTDTLSFISYYWTAPTTPVQVFLGDGSFYGASDKAYFWGAALNYQVRTGTSTFSTATNFENITGSAAGTNVLYGDANANTITGGNANDTIAGNGGADNLLGGAGDDTFLSTAANIAAVTAFNGSTGTDTLQVANLALAANTLSGSNSKYVSMEVLDVRNSTAGNTYVLNQSDIVAFADNAANSTVTLKIDTGDTFTASVTGTQSVLSVTAGADTIYTFYTDLAHTNKAAVLDVHTGLG